MKIKQEITILPLHDFIYDWMDKQLVMVFKNDWPKWLQKQFLFEGLHQLYQECVIDVHSKRQIPTFPFYKYRFWSIPPVFRSFQFKIIHSFCHYLQIMCNWNMFLIVSSFLFQVLLVSWFTRAPILGFKDERIYFVFFHAFALSFKSIVYHKNNTFQCFKRLLCEGPIINLNKIICFLSQKSFRKPCHFFSLVVL